MAELQRERDHLASIVDIYQEISASLHFVDILQTISRKLGETFGLDRCAIFLTGAGDEVRLVASYEDPTIRNLVVDLSRYPELQRAFSSGETVFIPDAPNDPMLRCAKEVLDLRNVKSIIVVPIRWRGTVIGAIFLRTERESDAFTESDVRFCQVIASLKGSASRSVRRKIAPIMLSCHWIGTTTIDRTLRRSSCVFTALSIGSFGASGMNTVSPDSKARLSSG